MRWRVPELALVLSDRAAALAKRSGDLPAWLRAEGLALFAANRLGRGVLTARRALTAVREAESAGEHEIAAQLRVELAWCAGSACSHEVALRVIEPVLRDQQLDPELRAHGLLVFGSCLPTHRQDEERFAALDEAERLYAQLPAANRDLVQVLQARVHVVRAGLHRRKGDFARAVEAVDSGTRLLRRLGDPAAEGGQVHAQLTYERVQGLLELGKHSEAVANAREVLAKPVRAASAVSTGWLGLVLAARVYLPEGNTPEAVRLLNDTAATAERYQLDELLAEALSTLSRLHEREGDYPAALTALRKAYSADRRWRSAVHAARLRLLEAFPGGATRFSGGQQSVFPAEDVSSPAGAGVAREPAEVPAPRQELGSGTAADVSSFPGIDPDQTGEQPASAEPATGQWPAVSPAEPVDDAPAFQDTTAERPGEAAVGAFPTEDSDAVPDSGADVTTILPVIAVPAESPPEPSEPQAAQTPQQDEQVDAEPTEAEDDSESSGRRSKGRSLAEIQASLQLAELPKREGRRRRRAVEDTGVTPAVEMLARHRPGWAQQAAAADEGAPAADAEDASAAAAADTEPAGQPAESDAGGDAVEELGKNAGLAELLAEAMVAYENGRRQQKRTGAEGSAGGRHSQPGATTTKSSTSEEGLSARHRRAAME